MLIISIYSNIYISTAVCAIYVGFVALRNKGKITICHFYGEKIYLIIFFLLLISGLIFNYSNTPIWHIIREIIRYISLSVYSLFCFTLLREVKKDDKFFYTIFLFCGFLAIKNVFTKSSLIFQNGFSISYSSLMDSSGVDSLVLAFGLYLSFFKPNFITSKYYFGKRLDLFVSIAIIISMMLSFQRTSFIYFLIFVICSMKKNTNKLLKIGMIFLLFVFILSFLFPDIYSSFIDKIRNSLTEISSSTSVWNTDNVIHNWRGYEKYTAQKMFYNFSFLNQLFGKGFGTCFEMPLEYIHYVTSEDTLPWLHDGYHTMIVKGGIIGLTLNLLFYFIVLLKSFKNNHNQFQHSISISVAIIFFINTLVGHGILWAGNTLLLSFLFIWPQIKCEEC